ncbi:MAG: hypothetical protein LBL71_01440 [Endomicrobium sp.]|jgi:hypothetical protein|nr:hypothetical protein [Endomicrobium sp.]
MSNENVRFKFIFKFFRDRILSSNKGQSMLEALFVVLFTTIMMLIFIQVCIMTVDDIIANEAAFVAARSAAVTESRFRTDEAEHRAKNYLLFFYPGIVFGNNVFNPSRFVLSNKESVGTHLNKINRYKSAEIPVENSRTSKSITIWKGSKEFRDYSGKNIVKETVKIYYFTRVLFGSLLARNNSFKNRRYQSSRNRMIPSPDEQYYYKAFPGAKYFEK